MNGDITMENNQIEWSNTPIEAPLLNPLEYFNTIKTFIFDVDGVMTDGKLLVTEGGEFLRTFHSRDGYAMRRAIEEGYNVCIITGGRGRSIESRLEKLGVKTFFTGADNKLPVYRRYCDTFNINTATVLYMGDDLNDYEVMQHVGLPCCPADACPEIMQLSHYVSPIKGGDGCVREVIEKVMKLQGTWFNQTTVSG